MNFKNRMQPVQKDHIFSLEDQGFYVWCGTITKDDFGVYYLYFSFWPLNKGFDAWVTHSKIGYAISNSPSGPFTYKGIILTGAGGHEWDRDCVHNPVILKKDGMYYLYYMGNYGNGEYWDHRNHQRIGVAYSKNPEGPFTRFDQPLIDVSDDGIDSLLTNNPTICIDSNNKIYMIYKCVNKIEGNIKGGNVLCSVALADHPLGPFVKTNKAIFKNPENPWSVEDPFMWYENDKFYAIAKDFQGYFTKQGKFSVALFESDNGLDWNISDHPLAFNLELNYDDGTKDKLKRMERPQIYIDENGKPQVLSCACIKENDLNDEHTFITFIKIK